MARGRPTTFSQDTFDCIICLIEKGASVRMACEAVGIQRRTLYRWMKNRPELATRLLRARATALETALEGKA